MNSQYTTGQKHNIHNDKRSSHIWSRSPNGQEGPNSLREACNMGSGWNLVAITKLAIPSPLNNTVSDELYPVPVEALSQHASACVQVPRLSTAIILRSDDLLGFLLPRVAHRIRILRDRLFLGHFQGTVNNGSHFFIRQLVWNGSRSKR
jgi:hypothetical protein